METRFALDKYDKKVFIDETQKGEDYFCLACHSKMVLKKGKIRVHHFAHPSHVECVDNWHRDMSEWHSSWQALFPREAQEVYKEIDRQKHIADVLLEDKKAVFEFQHSLLSPDEFDDRNKFYNSLGYLVIWVFDFVDLFEKGQIEEYKSSCYLWQQARKTFINFNPVKQKNNVELYFQTKHKPFENLIKVAWVSSEGFKLFATDGFDYSEDDIINRFSWKNIQRSKTIRLADLFDPLKEMYSDGINTFYSGCPESISHVCVKNDGRIIDRKMMSCESCGYSVDFCGIQFVCKKRFISTKLSGNTQVEIKEVSKYGFASKIEYELSDGIKQIVDLPTFDDPGEAIINIWKNEWKVAIFVNVVTLESVKFDKNPVGQFKNFGYAIGFVFAGKPFTFKGQWKRIYNCDKPEWFCLWSD